MADKTYEAWHRELGHSEYRITITMAGYGNDDAAAEAFLDGFLSAHPEVGPVVSQNSEEDTISITFSLQAGGQDHALTLGHIVFVEGGVASGLEPTDVVRAEVEPVAAAKRDELQPA